MPSTTCIYDKELVLLNLVTKQCSCLYMVCQGPYITVYIYTERFVIIQVFCGLTVKCFGGNWNCDKISAVFSNVNQIIKQKSKKIMTFYGFGQKRSIFYGHKI